jgi:DNA processing protein
VAKRDAQLLFAAAPLPTAKLGPAEQLACLRLIRSENVGPVTFRELINHFGGAGAALDALPELSRRGGRARSIRICPAADAEAELAAARKIGAEPVFTIEPGYPALLAAIDAPPPMLYIKGRHALLNMPAVAIVGSRLCSAAGSKLAAHFASGLGDAGYVVVSGLARGIDGVAHQAALSRGTVAVLAGGIDMIYPPEHGRLYAEIAEQGCLVSERPPGFIAREKDFPRRNRIISGLSLGVVIVEAAARSGTLTTARFASDQGRDVFAVPGHPLDPRAEGTNTLIKNGATLVTEPHDVIAALQPISGLQEPASRARWQPVEPLAVATAAIPPEVGSDERDRVAGALGPAPVDLDALVRATGLPLRTVRIALVELDLAGRISRPGPGLIALNVG